MPASKDLGATTSNSKSRPQNTTSRKSRKQPLVLLAKQKSSGKKGASNSKKPLLGVSQVSGDELLSMPHPGAQMDLSFNQTVVNLNDRFNQVQRQEDESMSFLPSSLADKTAADRAQEIISGEGSSVTIPLQNHSSLSATARPNSI
jgi:hypothetical protein